jgi:hypothetical protein
MPRPRLCGTLPWMAKKENRNIRAQAVVGAQVVEGLSPSMLMGRGMPTKSVSLLRPENRFQVAYDAT